MKKLLLVACLLYCCGMIQPAPALAALEQIPLPPGSDQLAPIEKETATRKPETQPAQKGGAAQPQNKKKTVAQKKQQKKPAKKSNAGKKKAQKKS